VPVELLFQFANLYIMPFWLLMILLPHWRWSRRILASLWIIAPLALIYSLLLFSAFAADAGAGVAELANPTLAGIAALLGNPAGAATGWLHFIAFDLFVGRWIYLESQRLQLSAWFISPILFFVLMSGPLGLLLYLLLRLLVGRATTAIHTPTTTI
jgi:hypothetical protein